MKKSGSARDTENQTPESIEHADLVAEAVWRECDKIVILGELTKRMATHIFRWHDYARS
jgi:hypothetical protein